MVIVNLSGGLGNQMFQYSLGESLSKRLNMKVAYSTTNDQYKNNFLGIEDVFNVKINRISSLELKSSGGLFLYNSFTRRAVSKISLLLHVQLGSSFIVDHEQGFQKIDISNNDEKTAFYIHGNWQSEKYFKEYFSIIKKQCFQFNQSYSLSELKHNLCQNEVKIGVHIRRGDYITNKKAVKKLGVQTSGYYISNLNLLKAKHKNSSIFVFSDDINWAIQMFSNKFSDIYFSDSNNNAGYDMCLLSQCDHFVLSNSSFGWWSAYLSNNVSKIVITPHCWFSDGSNETDLIPESWVKSVKI